jgi:long-chain acyl-CoA synthetase
MSWEMLNHPDLSKFDTSSLKRVGGGGAATAPKMVAEMASRFKSASPSQGFGMTETNAITTLNAAANYIARPSSCGKAVLMVDVAIFDDDNKALPVGAVGEVVIRGPTIMKEYWKKPEATKEVLVRDAEGKLWLKSGDMGRMDDDGYLYILDRCVAESMALLCSPPRGGYPMLYKYLLLLLLLLR